MRIPILSISVCVLSLTIPIIAASQSRTLGDLHLDKPYDHYDKFSDTTMYRTGVFDLNLIDSAGKFQVIFTVINKGDHKKAVIEKITMKVFRLSGSAALIGNQHGYLIIDKERLDLGDLNNTNTGHGRYGFPWTDFSQDEIDLPIATINKISHAASVEIKVGEMAGSFSPSHLKGLQEFIVTVSVPN